MPAASCLHGELLAWRAAFISAAQTSTHLSYIARSCLVLQVLPHSKVDFKFSSAAANGCIDKEQTDAIAALGVHLPPAVNLFAGQSIFLPTATPHAFAKRLLPGLAHSPSVSVAGDSSFIGGTSGAVEANLSAMIAGNKAVHERRQPVMSAPCLAVFACADLIDSPSPERLLPTVEQAQGVLPILESLIDEERKLVADLSYKVEIEVAPIQDAVGAGGEHGEYICARCKGEVANLHAWVPSRRESIRLFTCAYCLRAVLAGRDLTALPDGYKLSWRFYNDERLTRLLASCRAYAKL